MNVLAFKLTAQPWPWAGSSGCADRDQTWATVTPEERAGGRREKHPAGAVNLLEP